MPRFFPSRRTGSAFVLSAAVFALLSGAAFAGEEAGGVSVKTMDPVHISAGVPFSFALPLPQADDGWSGAWSDAWPDGVGFDPETRRVSGQLNEAGTHRIPLWISGVDGVFAATLTLVVEAAAPRAAAPAAAAVYRMHDGDKDKIDDFYWRHNGTHKLSVWYIAAPVGEKANRKSAQPRADFVNNVDAAYAVAGVGDFDGDGVADILWRHRDTHKLSVWFMNPPGGAKAARKARADFVNNVDLAYTVAGVGDFDANGRADVLWRHRGTHKLSIWYLNAPSGEKISRRARADLVNNVDAFYQIAGVGDVNGDAIADLIWRHVGTHKLSLWALGAPANEKVSRIGRADFANNVDSMYEIGQIADMNGDGVVDIVWRHVGTHKLSVWYMNKPANERIVRKSRADVTVNVDRAYTLAK